MAAMRTPAGYKVGAQFIKPFLATNQTLQVEI